MLSLFSIVLYYCAIVPNIIPTYDFDAEDFRSFVFFNCVEKTCYHAIISNILTFWRSRARRSSDAVYLHTAFTASIYNGKEFTRY
jgi:hypothetical protein